jgi:DNA-binding winged helix-turn-helix (wHTH) protein
MEPTVHPTTQDDHSRATNNVRGDVLEFDTFRVQLRRRQLFASGLPIALGTRAFDLLLVLIGESGRLLSKDELLSRVWPNTVVEENNLHVQIAALRKALGEKKHLIKTEYGRGYRFIGEVRLAHDTHDTSAELGGMVEGAGSNVVPLATRGALRESIDDQDCLTEILGLIASHQVVVLTVPGTPSMLARIREQIKAHSTTHDPGCNSDSEKTGTLALSPF